MVSFLTRLDERNSPILCIAGGLSGKIDPLTRDIPLFPADTTIEGDDRGGSEGALDGDFGDNPVARSMQLEHTKASKRGERSALIHTPSRGLAHL